MKPRIHLREDLKLGRIGGVDVAVNWSVLLILLLLTWVVADGYLPQAAPHATVAWYWVAGVVAALLLLASLLAHELAHAVVARHEGVEVEGLTLWVFGGVARLKSDAPSAGAAFRIAAIGPGVSITVGLFFGVITVALSSAGASSVAVGTAAWLTTINLALAVFNLLPGAPLDGGRILAAALWRRGGDRTSAMLSASSAGQVLAYVLMGLGIFAFFAGDAIGGLWTVLIGSFVLSAAKAEHLSALSEPLLRGVTAGDVMSCPVEASRADLTIDEFVHSHLLRGLHSTYPVVAADGSTQGLVTLHQLRALPAECWPTTSIGEVALPLSRVATCRASDRLADVHGTPETGGRVLVLDDGHVVGIVGPSDIARLLQTQALVGGHWATKSL